MSPPDVSSEVDGGRVDRSYTGGDFPSALSGIVDLAKADLAARVSASPADLAVLLVQEVVWANASLGCPLPGFSYAQVTTDGLRIVLGHAGSAYDYRTGGLSDPVLCTNPK